MAGTLTIDTLKASSGVLSVANGMTGILKAWVTFNGSGGVTINNSFNVSSVTRGGTGNYTMNFTTAMPNATYGWTCFATDTSNFPVTAANASSTNTTTSAQFNVRNLSSAQQDGSLVCFSIYSA